MMSGVGIKRKVEELLSPMEVEIMRKNLIRIPEGWSSIIPLVSENHRNVIALTCDEHKDGHILFSFKWLMFTEDVYRLVFGGGKGNERVLIIGDKYELHNNLVGFVWLGNLEGLVNYFRWLLQKLDTARAEFERVIYKLNINLGFFVNNRGDEIVYSDGVIARKICLDGDLRGGFRGKIYVQRFSKPFKIGVEFFFSELSGWVNPFIAGSAGEFNELLKYMDVMVVEGDV
jgi:hypothetical protein